MSGLLPQDRYHIVGLATTEGGIARESGFSIADLTAARAAHGDRLVHHLNGQTLPREAVAALPADVFLPAARTRSIGMSLADALQVKAVIPIANAPYAEGVVARLHARGIVSLPGFVTNCGGVFASSLHDSGVPRDQIARIFGPGYRHTVARLLERARSLGQSPVDTATLVAERALEQRLKNASPPTLLDKVRSRAVRRGPKTLRRRRAYRHCLESLAQLDADLASMARP